MKKAFLLLMVFTALISCKSEKNADTDTVLEQQNTIAEDGKTLKQSDGLVSIHGMFLYDDAQGASVLLTPTKMYGIVIDEKMRELNKQAEPFKTAKTDMVPVTIRGRLFKKDPNDDGWEDRIEIKEIIKVSKPDPEENDVIKLGSK
ncbi:MAG: hypothetical protein WA775_05370 [Psychroserpens sp.]|uniref:hypothetical protein n=1 Tax=Psychroserpens sp. TaxID=2020870 RepID=UPI003C72BCC2